ncbi:hypothetical protein GQ457_04G024470 [Hibiscus cannabinus]
MSDNRVDIPELTSENFKFWKESFLLQLGCLDIDYAIRKSEPSITDNNNKADLALYEKWERSNRLSIMFIKRKVLADVCGSIDQYKNVQDLLAAIEKQFQTSQKSLASTLIMKFTSLKLTTVKGVRDHINKMGDLAARLKALEVEMSDSFVVHYILNTLPPQYGSFMIFYNTHKDKRSTDELLTMCDQEEGRLILEMGESTLTVTQGNRPVQAKQRGMAKMQPQADIKKEFVCFFCKKKGHLKNDCVKYKGWLEKKDCIKGKQTNKLKKGAKRSLTILEIIHSDICCPYMDVQGQKYFITFIDDYSRYMYLYMLHHKSEALEAFKVFKAEVEKQCGKQIKIVRTDRGGEYYGRYTEDGQVPGPFAKFLQDNGTVGQYTMPDSPNQNGVAERRNRALMDMFYCPSHSTRIVESRNANFLENDSVSGSDLSQNFILVDQPSTSSEILVIIYNTPQAQTGVEQPINEVSQPAKNTTVDQVVHENLEITEQPVEQHDPQENVGSTLRRSSRERKSAISSDYVVYLLESDYNIGAENDPESFSQAMSCNESKLWYDAMKDEMNSMKNNEVWDLVLLPDGVKAIGCKWVFKTKKDSKGNIERYKAKLVAKEFTQREGIDYTETFSLVSKKDSLRIVLALVAQFDLELQQMD